MAFPIKQKKLPIGRGADWSTPPDAINGARMADLHNFDLINGKLVKRLGFKRLRYAEKAGGLGRIEIVNPGSGYTTGTTTVTISGGGGASAAATATASGGEIVEITITNYGSGYTSEPDATITSSGSGTGATAVCFLADVRYGPLGSHTESGDYSGEGTLCVRTTRPDGAGEWRLATKAGALFGMTFDSPNGRILYDPAGGTVYDVPLTCTDGSVVTANVGAEPITYCQIGSYTVFASLDWGVWMWDGTTLQRVPGFESTYARMCWSMGSRLFLADIRESPGSITGIDVVTGGTGYSFDPVITITGDGGGATAKAVVSGGIISLIEVTAEGRRYTSATVTITDTTGTAATATATIGTTTERDQSLIIWTDSWLAGAPVAKLRNGDNSSRIDTGEAVTAGIEYRRETERLSRSTALVWTESGCWTITGTSLDQAGVAMSIMPNDAPGCVGPRAVGEVDGRIVWISGEYGPVAWDGGDGIQLASSFWGMVKEKDLWPQNEKRERALVIWSPSRRRAMFTFPGMLEGMMDKGRIICWWPDAPHRDGDFEFTEYSGFWPTAACFGETEGGKEELIFIDDYGFPARMDYGYTDDGVPLYITVYTNSATATSAPVVRLQRSVPNTTYFKKDIYWSANALAGLYFITAASFTDDPIDTYNVTWRRITANTAQDDGTNGTSTLTINDSLDSVQASETDKQKIYLGRAFAWFETKAWDFGADTYPKQWHDVYLTQLAVPFGYFIMTTRHNLVNRLYNDWGTNIANAAFSPEVSAFADYGGANLPGGQIGTAEIGDGAYVWGDVFKFVEARYMLGGYGYTQSIFFIIYSWHPVPFEIIGITVEAQILPETVRFIG